MALFDALIQPNATVSVYTLTASKDASGGTSEAYSTLLTAGVQVLITQHTGSRDGRFEGRANVRAGTCTGKDDSLNSQKVRLLVTASDDVPWLVGKALYAESIAAHPPGRFGLVGKRYTLRWQQWEGG